MSLIGLELGEGEYPGFGVAAVAYRRDVPGRIAVDVQCNECRETFNVLSGLYGCSVGSPDITAQFVGSTEFALVSDSANHQEEVVGGDGCGWKIPVLGIGLMDVAFKGVLNFTGTGAAPALEVSYIGEE